MKSIIHDIYCGNLAPAEDIISQDPEYERLEAKAEREKEHLRSRMMPEDGKHLDRLEELLTRTSCMDIYAAYAYGLRLGFRLCLDVLEPKNPCD